jgi:hypothetical protein
MKLAAAPYPTAIVLAQYQNLLSSNITVIAITADS